MIFKPHRAAPSPQADAESEEPATLTRPRLKARLGIVIVHYRTPQLAIDCVSSMSAQLELNDARIVIVDNKSGDGSAEEIAAFLEDAADDRDAWKARVGLVRARANMGFAGGNNLGLNFLDADCYLLLHPDALIPPGGLSMLLDAADAHPDAGVIGPRVQDPEGETIAGAFHARSLGSEFVGGVRTGLAGAVNPDAGRARRVIDGPQEVSWVSFSAALLRRDALEATGPLDDGYFLHFEDADYCRSMRRAGWRIVCDPSALVIRLSDDSPNASPASQAYYASRTRYFRKSLGVVGPTLANLAWLAGRGLGQLGGVVTRRSGSEINQPTNIWRNWSNPMRDWREQG